MKILKTEYFENITWGVIEDTITPTRPAHWLAENLDNDKPTPTFPPKEIAASNGSQAVATSEPYLIMDSEAFFAIPFAIALFLSLRVAKLVFKFSPVSVILKRWAS